MTNAWIAELAKGLTAGTQAYQMADQDRKARAKQNFDMGVTLLDPDMASAGFAEMQAPDPVSRWLGSAMGAKQPDSSKQGAAIGKYLAMKRQEMEDERRARLVKAAGLGDAPVQFDDPVMAAPTPVPSLPPTTDQPLPLPPMAPPVPSSPMGPPVDAMEPPPTVTPWADTLGPQVDPGLAAPVAMTPPLSPMTGGFSQAPDVEMAANPFEAPADTFKNYVLPGVTPNNQMGLVEPGNIDLDTINAKMTTKGLQTVDAFPFKDKTKGKLVMLPLYPDQDGKPMSKEEAVFDYVQSGKSLGVAATPEFAEDYRLKFIANQAKRFGVEPTAAQQPSQAPPAPVAQAPAAPVASPVAAPPAAPPPTPAAIEPEILRPTGKWVSVPSIAGGKLPAVTDGNIDLIISLEKRKGKTPTQDFSTMSDFRAKQYLKELDSYPDRYSTHFFADAAGRQYRAIEDKVTGESTSTVLSSTVPVDKRGVPVNGPAGTLKYDKKTNTFSQMVEDLDRTGVPTKPAYRHTEAAKALPVKQETRADGIYNVFYAQQDPAVELRATRVGDKPPAAAPPTAESYNPATGKMDIVPRVVGGSVRPKPPQPPAPRFRDFTSDELRKEAEAEVGDAPPKTIRNVMGQTVTNPRRTAWDVQVKKKMEQIRKSGRKKQISAAPVDRAALAAEYGVNLADIGLA